MKQNEPWAGFMEIDVNGNLVTLTADQLNLFNDLTPLQRDTALYMLAGMKYYDAYKLAGGEGTYSNAFQLVNNNKVQDFLAMFRAVAIRDALVSRDESLEKLSNIIRADLSDFIDFDSEPALRLSDGETVFQSTVVIKSMDQIPEDQRRLIKKAKQTKYGIEIELHDPLVAQRMYNEMMGFNAPVKKEISGPGGGPIETKDVEISDEELTERLKQLGFSDQPSQLSAKKCQT